MDANATLASPQILCLWTSLNFLLKFFCHFLWQLLLCSTKAVLQRWSVDAAQGEKLFSWVRGHLKQHQPRTSVGSCFQITHSTAKFIDLFARKGMFTWKFPLWSLKRSVNIYFGSGMVGITDFWSLQREKKVFCYGVVIHTNIYFNRLLKPQIRSACLYPRLLLNMC